MRHTTGTIILLAAILGWLPLFCPGALAASRQEALDFALKRAALELSAGRPHDAARVLRQTAPQVDAGKHEALVVLVWAESELLAGNEEVAVSLLQSLQQFDDDFLRTQVEAHLWAVRLADPTIVVGDVPAWKEHVDDMRRQARREATWGHLFEAAWYASQNDSTAMLAAWQQARDGAARPLARLLLAENALQRGAHRQAEEEFGRLGKQHDDLFGGWLQDWATLGRARAVAGLGRHQEALAWLERVEHTEHLQHFAWLLSAQLLQESGRGEEALAFLGRLQLERWNASLAAEALLLMAQIHLDAGDTDIAEAVASHLDARLDVWFARGQGGDVLARELQLDLQAWHSARTRQTMQELAHRGLLRDLPATMQLMDAASSVVLVPSGSADSLHTRVTILAPYPHERDERALQRAAQDVAAHLQQLVRSRRYQEAVLVELERGLGDRRGLMQRALGELGAHASALQALHERGALAARSLQQYQEALAAQEAAWIATLEGRLRAWGAAIESVQQAQARLQHRYPHDRVLRRNPAVDTGRQVLEVADSWVQQMDSLQTVWQAQIASRVRQVLHELEPAAAAQQVAQMQDELARLQQRTGELARRLALLDQGESLALQMARERLQVLREAEAVARLEWQGAVQVAQQEASWRAALRADVYRQAAADVRTTAAFLAAVQAPVATARQRWAEAITASQTWVQEYPQGVRADEMWYRMGEAHLQHAALQYKEDLAHYLNAGAEAADTPLPVQDYAEALDAFDQVLQRFPASARVPEAHFQAGFLLAEMGSPEASSQHLEEFLVLASQEDLRRGSAALRIGDNHLQRGDRPLACVAFERAASAADRQASDLGLFKLGWCNYDLERPEEARQALRVLLARAAVDDSTTHARDLQPEALELLALAFADDHEVFEAHAVLQEWGAPQWDFVVKRRMAQLFANRALYDQAIHGYQHLFQEHPYDARVAGIAEEWMRLVEVRQGVEEAHDLAADLAVHFAPGSEWAQRAATDAPDLALSPAWQSRLIEEDRQAARVDSLSRELADPHRAAQRMAAHLRSAAVFAHQRAQQDSSQADHQLQFAAARYEQVLQHFPGSDKEAQIWLYLAEARAALGQELSAADAFAQAAVHSEADSALRAQAALGELVILDAAAERQPQQALARYEDTARRTLQERPGDPHGLDALERVGELAFRNEDWPRAEQAYVDFATWTDDRTRAAQAQKYAGDTWWQRQDAASAAQHYEVARQTAALSQQDSLVGVLDALIPGALYQAAVERHDDDEQDAIVLYERVAHEYDAVSFAPQALYAAAQLRRHQGDAVGAERNYGMLVRRYPDHELRNDALLESAAIAEEQERPAVAAGHLESLLDADPAYGERTAARLRIADLYLTAQQPQHADRHYAVLLSELQPDAQAAVRDSALAAELWLRRARMTSDLSEQAEHYTQALAVGSHLAQVDWAEARFHVTEVQRPRYQAIALAQPIDESLAAKQKALEVLLAGYGETLEQGVHPWHAAASLRLGESLAELGVALRDSEPPAALEGEDLWGWQEAMNMQAQSLEDRAVASWSMGLRGARDASQEDDWTAGLRDQLYPMLSQRIPTQPAPLFVLVTPEQP